MCKKAFLYSLSEQHYNQNGGCVATAVLNRVWATFVGYVIHVSNVLCNKSRTHSANEANYYSLQVQDLVRTGIDTTHLRLPLHCQEHITNKVRSIYFIVMSVMSLPFNACVLSFEPIYIFLWHVELILQRNLCLMSSTMWTSCIWMNMQISFI